MSMHLVLLSGLFALSFATGATGQQSVAPSKPTSQAAPAGEQPDFVIRMERTPCYGDCPFYTVTVLGDRSVTFISPGKAVRKGMVSSSDYAALVNQIESIDFFMLKDRYEFEVTDASGVLITVIAGYKVHGVFRYVIPCETEFRRIQAWNKMHPKDRPSSMVADAIRYDGAATPPPDGLCKLESMIDRMTGADKWSKR
jgi:hypothetical protein